MSSSGCAKSDAIAIDGEHVLDAPVHRIDAVHCAVEVQRKQLANSQPTNCFGRRNGTANSTVSDSSNISDLPLCQCVS